MSVSNPSGMAALPDGTFLVADKRANCVIHVDMLSLRFPDLRDETSSIPLLIIITVTNIMSVSGKASSSASDCLYDFHQ